jgi:8-amino-3,8-dideoxy-alpha-D-manno-octulosonate transaminase
MPKKVFQKVIDELAEMNFKGKIMPHHYGEPLLDTRLEKLVSYTKKKLPKSIVVIYTNGDFLTLSRYWKLRKAGVDQFYVTNHDNHTPVHIQKLLKDPEISPTIIFYSLNKKTTPLFNRGGLVKTNKTIIINKCSNVNNLIIDYRGQVTLCCNDYLSKYKFGDVAKEKVIDIWNQPDYVKLRQQINQGVFKLPICQDCTR